MESRSESARLNVQVPLEAKLALRAAPFPTGARRIALLLHGYEQDGDGLMRRCEAALPEDALALAPNAPFPLPRKIEGRYRVGFSWYFYDPYQDQYLIGPVPGVAFARGILERFNPQQLPVTLIGFSQGGYLAPFVAQEVPEVDHIVGIGCQFLEDEFDVRGLARRGCRMDSIHGAQDDVVAPETARASHASLVAAGIPGEFTLLEGTGHRIDEAVRGRLALLLRGYEKS